MVGWYVHNFAINATTILNFAQVSPKFKIVVAMNAKWELSPNHTFTLNWVWKEGGANFPADTQRIFKNILSSNFLYVLFDILFVNKIILPPSIVSNCPWLHCPSQSLLTNFPKVFFLIEPNSALDLAMAHRKP